MTKHYRNYINFYGLDEGESICSELSGEVAVDLHHIYPKDMGGRKTFTHEGVEYDIDAVENLIAVTRTQHNMCDAGDWSKDKLWDIHQRNMVLMSIDKYKDAAQEKAKELVEKFSYKVTGYGESKYQEKLKQCALIAVDEIIDSHSGTLARPANKLNIEYWQEVKEEIEKL